MLARSSVLTVTSVPGNPCGDPGQTWRGGPRQTRLPQVLAGIDCPRSRRGSRAGAAGELLGAAGQSGVIDAAVVLIAHDGGDIITSDPAPTCVLLGGVHRGGTPRGGVLFGHGADEPARPGRDRLLEKVSRLLLAELARRAPLLPGKDVLAFIDIDSQQKRVYGHHSRQLHPPRPDHPPADLSCERIKRRPVLGGLVNEYERAA